MVTKYLGTYVRRAGKVYGALQYFNRGSCKALLIIHVLNPF